MNSFNVFIQEKAVEVAERLKKNRTLVSPEKASLEELRQECSELQKERQGHLVWIGALQVEIKNKTQRLNTLKTDAENLKQEAANLGKILHTKRTEILELVRKLNKLENDMTNLEQQLREKQEKVQQLESEKRQLEEWLQQAREERESVRNELTKKITDLEKLRIEDQGKFDLLELERDAEIRSKQTQLNEKDGIIKNREKNLEQNTETSADNHRLTTELREKTEELRNAIRQKRIGNLFAAGVWVSDYLPLPEKWRSGVKSGFNAGQAWLIASDIPNATYEIIVGFAAILVWYGIKAIWYRIFGRKEINKLQELREELKEVRGKLLQAQLAAVIKDKEAKPTPKTLPQSLEKEFSKE